MVIGADSRKKWDDLDILIMSAYQVIKDEECGQCGMPRWLCHNSDPKLQVRVKYDECVAKRAIDDARESRKDSDKDPGVAYPEFYDLDERPLESFRDLYYEQLAEEAAEEEEDE